MAPFRLGLVGAGRMGRTHLRALAVSERVAVTAIAEMSTAAREAAAAPGVRLHASLAAMLDASAIDGVLIAAPTDQHGAIIAEVAAHGLPIL
jgi:myo-inositol 2-dehydrogenase/D-chiro-inositol 1-dehydrogenase